VNSFHHQAIARVGSGRRFVLGVQWHPESFWNREDGFQPLFTALVGASRS